ncbi:MAG: HDOD domain-containing protein [Pseudomonadota bacterium]
MKTDKPNLLAQQASTSASPAPTRHQQRNWTSLTRQLQLAAKNKRASAEEISRVIGDDEQFCARITHVAGRLYAGSVVIDSVARAIVLIGIERLCQLAESQSVWRMVD